MCPRCETYADHGAKFCSECATSLLPANKSGDNAAVNENGLPLTTIVTIPMGNIFDSKNPLSYEAMTFPPKELAEKGISDGM